MVVTPSNAPLMGSGLIAVDAAREAKAAQRVSSGSDDGSFGRALDQADHAIPAASPAFVGSVNPMLMHELGLSEHARRDSEARRHGRALLDALTELQRALLGEEFSQSLFENVASLLASIPQATDPALSEILRAIAVRATVELCRHRAG